jgi:hypothetical protein
MTSTTIAINLIRHRGSLGNIHKTKRTLNDVVDLGGQVLLLLHLLLLDLLLLDFGGLLGASLSLHLGLFLDGSRRSLVVIIVSLDLALLGSASLDGSSLRGSGSLGRLSATKGGLGRDAVRLHETLKALGPK